MLRRKLLKVRYIKSYRKPRREYVMECLCCKKPFNVTRDNFKKGNNIFCSISCSTKTLPHPRLKRYIKRGKYKYVLYHGHHSCKDKKSNHVAVHRLVMEHFLKRKLKDHEIVHHINHNMGDNRIENLELYDNTGHHVFSEHIDVDPITGQFTSK